MQDFNKLYEDLKRARDEIREIRLKVHLGTKDTFKTNGRRSKALAQL